MNLLGLVPFFSSSLSLLNHINLHTLISSTSRDILVAISKRALLASPLATGPIAVYASTISGFEKICMPTHKSLCVSLRRLHGLLLPDYRTSHDVCQRITSITAQPITFCCHLVGLCVVRKHRCPCCNANGMCTD